MIFFYLGLIFLIFADSLVSLGFFLPPAFKHIFIFIMLFFTLIVNQKIKVDIDIHKKIFLLILYSCFIQFLWLNSIISFAFSFFYFIFFYVAIFFGEQIVYKRKRLDIVIKHIIKISLIPLIVSLFMIFYGYFQGDIARTATIFFREIGTLASYAVLLLILCLYISLKERTKKYILIAFLLSFFIIMTTMKKAMVIMMIMWFLYLIFIPFDKTRIFKYGFIYISAPIVFFLFLDDWIRQFTYLQNVGADSHVRIGMYIASFNIFYDYFPFGSGFGTFGSIGSLISGISPSGISTEIGSLYHEYGIANLADNSNEKLADGNTTFLDTYWPHMISELGLIGLLIYAYIVYGIFKNISSISYEYKFLVSCFYIFLFLEGLVLFTPEMPLFVFIIFSIIGYLNINRQRLNKI